MASREVAIPPPPAATRRLASTRNITFLFNHGPHSVPWDISWAAAKDAKCKEGVKRSGGGRGFYLLQCVMVDVVTDARRLARLRLMQLC